MSQMTKLKHVSDVDMNNKNIMAKKPFKVSVENKRRFIRLEISSPVMMKMLQGRYYQPSPEEDSYKIQGTILNISAGGMLVELEEPVYEDDVVLLQFTLQDNIIMSDVLGLVKRVDKDEKFYLAGIEFVSQEFLQDRLSKTELEFNTTDVADFEQKVQETLSKYLYRPEVTH